MASGYPFQDIEKKWQVAWERDGIYHAHDGRPEDKADKFYGLIEFPYPSGEGLHVGHPRSYTALDIMTRKQRMEGKNVLYPIGWDAFGLPTENFAIKHKVKPQDATKKNVANFTRQLKSLGFGFDWSREINTTDPAYYKWTQWMFLRFFNSYFDPVEGRARPIGELAIPDAVREQGDAAVRTYVDGKRMAYKAESTINWCPRCKIGLANEEAQGGVCERCGADVEQRIKAQWMIRITSYADRLIDDLETVDYLEKIKAQQINWIGRSKGAYVDFTITGPNGLLPDKVTVFTTRPDTLFGATYLVLAPEHPLIETWIAEGDVTNADEVRAYQAGTTLKSELQRQENKEKTGVALQGVMAKNPANGEMVPVWIADYVLGGYGTGAIMAVPAHDERDHAFAQTFGLPVKVVVEPVTGTPQSNEESRTSIIAIVRDPKSGKVLTLDWKKNGGRLLIGGGIENGEDPVACAEREIREETGYTHVRLVSRSEVVHHHYFAYAKGVARNIDVTGYLFDLVDDVREDAVREPHEAFQVEWVDITRAEEEIKDPAHAYLLRKLLHGTCYTDAGVVTSSGFLDGLSTAEAKEKMIEWLSENGVGERKTTYRLRDWVFSRQRYWGEPIPIVICNVCGYVPVPDAQLPIMLPEVENYEPTDSGESPLAAIRDWVETTCPHCGKPAERETDTMPNWAGSSWYFLRYCDPHNDDSFADQEKLSYWMPVDLYNGGMEHTTLHLLYSRFWYKVLFDLDLVPRSCGSEPYAKRRSHALILGEGGVKMSKSRGNVVNPDEVVERYGADVFRLYEMFIGPFDQDAPWDTNGIEGVRRFLDKVWNLYGVMTPPEAAGSNPFSDQTDSDFEILLNRTVKKVGEDIEGMHFNTAVSALMILVNAFVEGVPFSRDSWETLLKLLAPFAPHITDELWRRLGHETSIHVSVWPTYDASKLTASTFELVIQVNGKVRDKITLPSTVTEADAKEAALSSEKVNVFLDGAEPKKIVYVPGRLVSIST